MGLMKRFASSSRGKTGSLVNVEMTRWFFDRDLVKRSVDKATREVLGKFGAFVRRKARWSIRTKRKRLRDMTAEERAKFKMINAIRKRKGYKPLKRPKVSGSEPGQPPANITGLLKAGIFFAYEPTKQNVAIGPVRAGPGTADVLEYGGYVRITAGKNTGQLKRVAARPYMRPAFEATLERLPPMWRDSVKLGLPAKYSGA